MRAHPTSTGHWAPRCNIARACVGEHVSSCRAKQPWTMDETEHTQSHTEDPGMRTFCLLLFKFVYNIYALAARAQSQYGRCLCD